jgi:hypothetical protein
MRPTGLKRVRIVITDDYDPNNQVEIFELKKPVMEATRWLQHAGIEIKHGALHRMWHYNGNSQKTWWIGPQIQEYIYDHCPKAQRSRLREAINKRSAHLFIRPTKF